MNQYRPGNWSLARWVYPIGLPLEIGPLVGIPFVAASMLILRAKRVIPRDDPRPTLWLVIALLGGVGWLIMRQQFLNEKVVLYPSARLTTLDGISLLLYIMSFSLIIALITQNLRTARWQCATCLTATVILSLALLIAGMGIWGVIRFPETVSRWVGRESEEYGFAFYALFSLLWMFIASLGDSLPHRSPSTSETKGLRQ